MKVVDLLNKINIIIMATEDTKKENMFKNCKFESIEALAYKEILDAFGEFKKSIDQDTNIL